MAYHKELFQPVDWALVLGFQSPLSDSCLLAQGSLTNPVPLHFHSHLQEREGQELVKCIVNFNALYMSNNVAIMNLMI